MHAWCHRSIYCRFYIYMCYVKTCCFFIRLYSYMRISTICKYFWPFIRAAIAKFRTPFVSQFTDQPQSKITHSLQAPSTPTPLGMLFSVKCVHDVSSALVCRSFRNNSHENLLARIRIAAPSLIITIR